jgi:hypothetical protein
MKKMKRTEKKGLAEKEYMILWKRKVRREEKHNLRFTIK